MIQCFCLCLHFDLLISLLT